MLPLWALAANLQMSELMALCEVRIRVGMCVATTGASSQLSCRANRRHSWHMTSLVLGWTRGYVQSV